MRMKKVYTDLLLLLALFTAANAWIYSLYSLREHDKRLIIPRTMAEVRAVGGLLREWKETDLVYTLLFFSSAYLYKQTFALPGSICLNMVAGSVFGTLPGFLLSCFLSALGASLSFLMSRHVNRSIINTYFSLQRLKMETWVRGKEELLFDYLVALWLFPFTPNWLLNLACPHVGVPWPLFLRSLLLGLGPFIFISVQAGQYVDQIKSIEQVMALEPLAAMTLLSVGVLLFSRLKQRPSVLPPPL